MKNKIKIKCPCCNEILVLEIDKDFNILNIKNDDVIELSESQINNLLQENNIEIG